VLSFGEVVGAELPSFRWISQARLEPRLLLLFRDMKVEFENGYVILREMLLEEIYLAIARLDSVHRYQPVHTGHQYILVMRSVEDADHPRWGYSFVDAPQKIMRQLARCWFLEVGRDGTDGVDRAEDTSNGAILAAGIRTLQDHQ
jgi:hypothetical protein